MPSTTTVSYTHLDVYKRQAQDPRADFNGDQQIDAFDYLDFVAAFEAGCD